MQINEALKELGVTDTTLTPEEKAFMDENGYLVLHGVLSKEEVALVKGRLRMLSELEGEDAGKEVHQEAGTARLSNLVDKGKTFQLAFTHPKVLAAAAHVLGGNMKLSSLNSRAALPGKGLQGLHADCGEVVQPGDYRGCNSVWILTDFTKDNGATRVVPGSHRWAQLPWEAMDHDTEKDHPQQLIVQEPAGTVVVFNAHTWHGGTTNRTNEPRDAMHCYFGRRDQQQQTIQREWLSPKTIEAFSPAVRCLLDVE